MDEAMKNQPGLSWGPDRPVNAVRTSRGWLLINFAAGRRIEARVPKRFGVLARSMVLDLGSALNYGNVGLDAATKAAIDETP